MTVVQSFDNHAKQLAEKGYHVVPIPLGKKYPAIQGWQNLRLSVEDIDCYKEGGFGILTGIGDKPVYGLDCDCEHQKTADEVIDNFELYFKKPVIRIGKAPKFLIPFRMERSGIKKKTAVISKVERLEMLGVGQQFVAYHIHPDTREPYIWSEELRDIEYDELPLLTEEKLQEVFAHYVDLFPEKKKKVEANTDKWKSNNNRQYTNREIKAFLSFFGESFYNGSHDVWIPVVMAVHHETRGSDKGKAIAKAWSKQGHTYDEDNFNYKWDTFDFEEIGDDTKKRSTFDSLFYKHGHLIPNALKATRFSDAYNKAMFTLFYSKKLRYAIDKEEWYEKHGCIWKKVQGAITGYISKFLVGMKYDNLDLCTEYEDDNGDITNPRSLYLKAYKQSKAEEHSKANSTAKLLQAQEGQHDVLHITSDKFDANNQYMGETNGILDLETGEQAKITKELYITKSTNTPFATGKPSEAFINLISGYFETKEVMDFFARVVGMALLGNNEAHKIVNLLGVGRSGKSTLIKLLEHAFGEQYISTIQFKDITSAYEGDTGTPSPSIISAFGSRIAVVNETNEYAPLNEAVVKAITGGDTIAARLLFSNVIIRKRASFTPFIVTNKPLFIRSIDNSIWERLIIIPFKKRIDSIDPTLESKLADYALDAKRWFLGGVQDYLSRNHQLDIPEICIKAAKEERYELDTIQKWLEDYCEIGDGLYETTPNLAESYNKYLREEEKARLSVKTGTLTKQLVQKDFITDRINTGKGASRRKVTIIKGLKIRDVTAGELDNVVKLR
ncbi:phage/plasmid primase, P4 family [Candidatus Liberibacter americanus]|uniref:Putative ATPase n=1 Tax=Candidatus Liberibacter americanus str. Sao Paulo TaxID=1261131 RepID=U6B4L0_9HYPH|nr:phage/plasmid primase, P4 family [Candidatus Liberibacter americanus]AHA28004.1 putative ATPase [Candidatus Liberibacter americanus str. Sao Paulo]EMS35799.1 P4 family phage/plasmid primase [Candidatus Liberibacter americanus PW_SP]